MRLLCYLKTDIATRTKPAKPSLNGAWSIASHGLRDTARSQQLLDKTAHLYRVCSQASSGAKCSCSMSSHSSSAVSMCFSVSTCSAHDAIAKLNSLKG